MGLPKFIANTPTYSALLHPLSPSSARSSTSLSSTSAAYSFPQQAAVSAMATMSASLAVSTPTRAPVDTLSPTSSFTGLKAGALFAPKVANPLSTSNGSRVSAMLVLNPYNNDKYETLSYLPPLNQTQIAKQVEYMVKMGWTPCIEFDRIGGVYRKHFHGSGYYDGRYWVMWKLPMFGCADAAAVLREIDECVKEHPDTYVRVLGFDANRQVQVAGFLVRKPKV